MKSFRNTKGQSIVETALIMPILLLVLTGIIDFGLMFSNYLVVINASREGSRYAAVGYTDTQVRSIIHSVTGTLDSSKISVDIYPAESMRQKGDEVIVTINYDYSFFTPIIGSFVPDSIHLKGKTTMRIE